jgi:signal transduction histidine kinase
VLDESLAPLTTSPGELRKVSRQAPLIFIGSAAAGPLLAPLVADGHADFVNRQCGFALLAAALIERRVHTANVLDIYGASARSVFQSAFSIALAGASPGGFPKELVATLRHEINNPLTGILGNAELLLRSADRSSLISTKRLEIIVELAVRLREEVLGIT